MQNEDNQKKGLALPGQAIDPGEIDAAEIAVRNFANATIFGKYLSDPETRTLAIAVVTAITNYRNGTSL